MTISILAAAKRMCAQSDWSLSNLRLQKLLYIAQMYHLGQEDARLINGHFEAWDYGPVNPGLYHRVKVFGASPVQNIFSDIADLPDCTEAEYLDSVVERFEDSTSGTLVAITHWEQGAWSKHYVPGDRDCVIPDSDIKQEYMDRKRVFEQKPQGKTEPPPKGGLGAELTAQPTGQDRLVESLQEKLAAERDARREERFMFVVLIVLLFDVVFFSVMDNFGGPLAILVLELLVLVPLAQKLGLQEIALIANRLLSRIAGSITSKSND